MRIRDQKMGSFGKGVFQKSLRSRDSREFRDSKVENKGESDHFLEILENLQILEILEIPPVKRPSCNESQHPSSFKIIERHCNCNGLSSISGWPDVELMYAKFAISITAPKLFRIEKGT